LASPNFNQNQSAYRSGHSTETALLLFLDSIYYAADGGRSTLPVSLDLSAAFDTINHDVGLLLSMAQPQLQCRWRCSLLDRHTSLIGVNLFVLVHTLHKLSRPKSACPKAPCSGNFFSLFYTSPISKISMIYNVQQQQKQTLRL